MAGFERLGQTQECLVILHSRIAVLTSDILKICICGFECDYEQMLASNRITARDSC